MNVPGLRSPYDTVGGIVHFGRMLDKIRLHAQSKLAADYHPNLGIGFDARCCSFLRVSYAELVARVEQGGTDEEILQWCFERGRKPTDEVIEIWNDFMRKRGWRDSASEALAKRLSQYDLSHRKDILTFFDIIEVDEGRAPRS